MLSQYLQPLPQRNKEPWHLVFDGISLFFIVLLSCLFTRDFWICRYFLCLLLHLLLENVIVVPNSFRFWMICTECLLAGRQRSLVKRLRFLVLPLVVVEGCQVVK